MEGGGISLQCLRFHTKQDKEYSMSQEIKPVGIVQEISINCSKNISFDKG